MSVSTVATVFAAFLLGLVVANVTNRGYLGTAQSALIVAKKWEDVSNRFEIIARDCQQMREGKHL